MHARIPRLRIVLLFGAALLIAASTGAPPASGHGGERVRVRPWGPPVPMPAAAAPPERALGEPKRLYIANDDHTDYYWTADGPAYRGAFLTMLDYYMNQAEATASNPPDSRGRFNCDGSLWVREYEAARSPAQFQRLVGHLRAGNITMPLNTLILLYGAMPAEAVLRNMYWAGRLERRENLRFPVVVPVENQTLPGGVASLWAGSGARYSWKGICDCATQIDAGDRPREAYRFTGPDGQSVLMKWNSQLFGNQSIGGYAEARDPDAVIPILDSNPTFLSRWPWSVAGAFGYGWDDFITTTDQFIEASQDLSNASRRVIVSNEVDFFEDFEATHGAELESWGGAFGNEWDLYTASLGAVTSRVKRTVEKLRTAEALATLASLFDPGFMNGRESARDSAFMACGLYYEHNWTADGQVGQSVREAWSRGLADALSGYTDRLLGDGLSRLGTLVPQATAERHVVFNPLSWTRTDVVDLAASTAAPRHVVDVATGQEVPSQSVTVDGQPRLRILASAVPSVGYRLYEVRSGAGAVFPPAAAVAAPTLDHTSYRVTLGTRGQITSVLDHKDGDRELVAGGGIFDLGAGTGSVSVESSGPVSATLRVAAGGFPLHEARVTVYTGVDRIDVEQRITQNFGSDEWYLSPFNLPGAITRHEEVGMIASAARHSQGGDYAEENTRTDWLTLNHFVDLSQTTRGVTVSAADASFFRLGNSTHTTLDTSTPTLRTVVGMQVDGTSLGIPDQGGDNLFVHRYSLCTHGAYDPAAAMRFALEHQNPLVATPATGGPGAPLQSSTWSLISLPGDVLLWALKPAEEGMSRGVIARVWNLAEGPRLMSLGLTPFGLVSAQRTTHIETDLGPVAVSNGRVNATLPRQQMATFRLFPAGTVLDSPGVATPRALDLSVYPNPGVSGVGRTIVFTLSNPGPVRVDVHDLRGARVAVPVDGFFPAGRHAADWDGHDAAGRSAPPGVYFVRVSAAGREETRRMIVLR